MGTDGDAYIAMGAPRVCGLIFRVFLYSLEIEEEIDADHNRYTLDLILIVSFLLGNDSQNY